jgi:hypothetical protein
MHNLPESNSRGLSGGMRYNGMLTGLASTVCCCEVAAFDAHCEYEPHVLFASNKQILPIDNELYVGDPFVVVISDSSVHGDTGDLSPTEVDTIKQWVGNNKTWLFGIWNMSIDTDDFECHHGWIK